MVLQWLQSAHKRQQVFVANRAAKILENSSMDQWRQVKGIENPADIGNRGMSIEGLNESVWLNGPGWLHTDEEKLPKPWCQLNKVEAEQATGTVAAETKLHQTFDWDRYSSFNRIRNFIAYCMRFKTNSQTRRDPLSRTNSVAICSSRKLPECFEVDNKQQGNLQDIEYRQIVTIHRGGWNNLSERSTEAFKPRLQCKTTNTVDSEASSSTISVGESSP
ncbi:uncharacterized protein LOC142357685 [Convolutriloba macropyga]|uniref:uncharacterized protein LOC142357685 n=1 Tax=Convolutriloba macropyga TaxID=536237 RepID=UPI003F51B1B3